MQYHNILVCYHLHSFHWPQSYGKYPELLQPQLCETSARSKESDRGMDYRILYAVYTFFSWSLSYVEIKFPAKEKPEDRGEEKSRALSKLVGIEKRDRCWQLNALIFFWEQGLSFQCGGQSADTIEALYPVQWWCQRTRWERLERSKSSALPWILLIDDFLLRESWSYKAIILCDL